MIESQQAPEGERGFALIGVVGLLAVAAMLLASATRASIDWHRAKAIEREAIIVAEESTSLARRIADARFRAPSGISDMAIRCRIANGWFVEVFAHDGLVDLNAASPAILALALSDLSPSPGQLAEAIAASRSRDGRVASIEAVTGGAKGGAFEAIGELHDFDALAWVPLARLVRRFTVHRSSGVVHANVSPPGLRERLSPQIDRLVGLLGAAPRHVTTLTVVVRSPDARSSHEHVFRAATDLKRSDDLVLRRRHDDNPSSRSACPEWLERSVAEPMS